MTCDHREFLGLFDYQLTHWNNHHNIKMQLGNNNKKAPDRKDYYMNSSWKHQQSLSLSLSLLVNIQFLHNMLYCLRIVCLRNISILILI